MPEFVYFAERESDKMIKIGYSANVWVRMKYIGYVYRASFKLLGVIEGGHKKELELHRQFRAFRPGRHEMFYPAIEIREFIEAHALPMEPEEEQEQNQREFRDSELIFCNSEATRHPNFSTCRAGLISRMLGD